MDKNAAATLIKDTLQQPFDKARYTAFVKNLLNTIDEEKAFSYFGQYVPEKFRDFVKGYERIGTYSDPSDQKVDVLIVYLKNDATLARARTSQRNFISNYLKTRDAKDAGLIAFVAPNPEEWRFSFVKMEYKLVEKKGKVRAEEEFTPARRYSFLVGQHESSHTAQRQLLPILADDKHNPTLEIIENAFNIETVTKEFFEKYRELFLLVKEALDALAGENAALKKEFEAKNVNTADFAKKLLGQIVFLYFLQKKGWFGVERDSVWGSGPKNFLRQLFEGKLMKYGNFFNDVLEPLFYEALAVERESNFYSKFNCKIPFLNGGLFDPLNSYDWVHTDITLPNELFSNDVRTKEGDIGMGILDMFDRYNFTVKEDEPLEKEVAVDPEMLGKVFENLLEVNDRKSKGTYYTPREIVHYMCQESIINYLVTELEGNVSKDDITMFIHMGDTVIEHEIRVVKKGEETDTYSFKLPESIRKNAALIDQKLATIRVCDPAIGSGAFPVGMMNEIVRARQTLTSYLPASEDRLPYDFKRHAIQESLYGVDIDPGAVEIAKLRLWLSLIVDEDDIELIKPLPNLDYRIMQGNSLLEEFEGIRLFDERLLETVTEDKEKQLEEIKAKVGALQQEYFALHSDGMLTDARKEEIENEIKRQKAYQKQLQTQPQVSENMGIFDTPSKVTDMLIKLKGLHRAFFEATQRKKKEELKNMIEKFEWELIETSLTERNKGETLIKLKKNKTRPFFIWKLYFFEVFQQKGGFDVIIGNPPYVRIQEIQKDIASSLKEKFVASTGKFDLSVCFIEKGFSLLAVKGFLCFINPNKFITSSYGKGIKQVLASNRAINAIIDFGASQNFESATTYTCILCLSKKRNEDFRYCKINNREDFEHVRNQNLSRICQFVEHPQGEDDWIFGNAESTQIISKLNIKGKLEDYCDEIFQGLISGGDKFFFLQLMSEESDAFVVRSLINGEEYEIERDVCYYLLKGTEIKRYSPLAYKYVTIYPYELDSTGKTKLLQEEEFAKKYPKAFSYLSALRKELESRGSETMEYENWYSMWCPRTLEKFIAPKILTQVLAKHASFTLDTSGKTMFVGGGTAGGYGIIPKNNLDIRFMLGVLNSSLMDLLIKRTSTVFRGEYYAYARRYLAPLPFADFTESDQEHVILLVDKILEEKKKEKTANTAFYEKQVDDCIFELFKIKDPEKTILFPV